ncbi:MAG TPA: FtsX-like permease family protein [Caulobacteraceae bacterium]|nr:FtsX-like permease family protein [Caulobacteraceae bacterium]
MFRNYLVTALRNLARNWLYGAISILGLAVAFAAALLIAQFVRGEFSYDRWIPGYERVQKIYDVLAFPGQPPSSSDVTQGVLARQLKAALPDLEAVTRFTGGGAYGAPLKHRPGDAGVNEKSFSWVDPEVFKVFPLPALAGDLQSALQQPDTVVITRNMARKYFHRDLPLGDTLYVQVAKEPPRGEPSPTPGPDDWHPLRVTAVLKDLPPNTILTTEIYASGRSTYSFLARMDAQPPNYGGVCCLTFVRLAPKTSAADLRRALDIATRPESARADKSTPGGKWLFHGVPLADVHLTAPGRVASQGKPVGSRSAACGIAGVGALIVLVAAINFVTLMTARAARRRVEVGVRKATGAGRRDLIVQFLGEALLQVALAALIAVGLAELLLPAFSAFVQRGLTLDFIGDPVLLPGLAVGVLTIGLLAAIYPALVLSSFQPAAALKGGAAQVSGSPVARQALVVVQFAILVGLIVTAVTLYRQTRFSLVQGLGTVDTKLIVTVFAACDGAFPKEVRKLPGVAGAVCSSTNALNAPNNSWLTNAQRRNGPRMTFTQDPVDFGFFELYGVKPLAGRLFERHHGEDGIVARDRNSAAMPSVIVNETAARQLGFADPRAAVGQQMLWGRFRPKLTPRDGPVTAEPSTIVGVVPDMPVTVRLAAEPTFYYVTSGLNVLSIRLTGQDIPGTVKGIEATWRRTGAGQPLAETFMSQARLDLYLDLVIQGATLAICAGLAILIACLGLFALSAFTTERRTKEIGVRKAMGAETRQVVLLLLWQFTLPVLVATVIAVPIGFLAMDGWLHGFAYHVDLPAWTFVLAAVAAVAIAWGTVCWQSFMVARAKPAGALRYE